MTIIKLNIKNKLIKNL